MKKQNQLRILTISGSALLTLMGIFHGSGIKYIGEQVNQSDLEEFIKEIFPVLFAHPSIQLLGLAALGILSLYMKEDKKKVLFFISAMVLLDVLLAFYLSAIIPGILLLIAAAMFGAGGFISKSAE